MVLKLVLLGAPRCTECDRQSDILGEVRQKASSAVQFREIEMGSDTDAARHYAPQTHPTLILERDGRELRRWTRVTERDEILAALELHVERHAPLQRAGTAIPALPGGPRPAGMPTLPERTPPGPAEPPGLPEPSGPPSVS